MMAKMVEKFQDGNLWYSLFVWGLLVAFAGSSLAGCVPPPPRHVAVAPEPVVPPPSTKVYFYPNMGQSQEQQDRDSYECYIWSKEQTGFDPSATSLAPHQRLEVVPGTTPGALTAVGAITGAVLGAVVASRGKEAEGLLIGGLAGAAIGSASDAASQQQAARVQHSYDRQARKQRDSIERRAADYRRAMAACLEGRGYNVR